MNLHTLYKIALYAQILSLIVPLLLYFFTYKKNRQVRHLHFIGALVIFSFIVELFVQFLPSHMRREVIPYIHNLFLIVQFCLLSFFYYEILMRQHGKIYVSIILAHVIISSLLAYLLAKDIFGFNGLTYTLSNVVFLSYSACYFKKVFWVTEEQRIEISGTLWINAGILVYFSIAVWAFILRDQSITNLPLDTIRGVWIVHNLGNIAKNILFAKGFQVAAKNLTRRQTH